MGQVCGINSYISRRVMSLHLRGPKRYLCTTWSAFMVFHFPHLIYFFRSVG